MLEDPVLEIRFRNKGKLSRLEDSSVCWWPPFSPRIECMILFQPPAKRRATNEWLAEAKMKKNINRMVLNIVDISN